MICCKGSRPYTKFSDESLNNVKDAYMPQSQAPANAILDQKTGFIIEEVPAAPIKYIVIEGGGIRGRAYEELVNILKQANILAGIEHIGGSSAGAITAMLIAIGCSVDEVHSLVKDLSFKKFMEKERKPWPMTPELIVQLKKLMSIFFNEGNSVSSGRLLLEWIETIIEKKLGNKHATFADLTKLVKTNPEVYKYLSVVGTNLTKNRSEVFNHETTPNMPISIAIRISASFPFHFQAVPWNNGQSIDLYVDGGVNNNTPGNIFNDRRYLPPGYDFTDKGANPATVILKVDTKEEMLDLLWRLGKGRVIRGLKDLTVALIDSMQSKVSEIYDMYSTNVIQIFDGDVDTLKEELTENEKDKLKFLGQVAILEWLQNHYNEASSVRVYKTEKEWLSAKSIEELKQIKLSYIAMLKSSESSEVLTVSMKEDKDHFEEALKNKINWFDYYMKVRLKQLIYEETDITFTSHIDLKVINPRQAMNDCVKMDLKNKLSMACNDLSLLEKKITHLMNNVNHYSKYLHNNLEYDQIFYLVKLQEKWRMLSTIKKDLQNKLELKYDITPPLPMDIKEALNDLTTILKTTADKFLTTPCYANFLNHLTTSLQSKLLIAMSDEGLQLDFDIRELGDLKLWVMSLMIYLTYTEHFQDLQKKLKPLYQLLFGTEKVPKNMEQLGQCLVENKIHLYVSAYKIEAMINLFLKEKETKNISYIYIDYIFDCMSSSSLIKKKYKPCSQIIKEEEGDIELEYLCDVFFYQQYEKFLIFNGSKNQAFQHKPLFNREKLIPETSSHQLPPRALRRYGE